MSSKLDPFATLTADAKIPRGQATSEVISLASAEENNVNAWRATRDLLREQLVETDATLGWRRKYQKYRARGEGIASGYLNSRVQQRQILILMSYFMPS